MTNTIDTLFFSYWAKNVVQDADSIEFVVPLDTETMPFLEHHTFVNTCLVPAAVMTDMLVEACAMIVGTSDIYPLNIESMDILRGVQVDYGGSEEVTVHAYIIEDFGTKSSIGVEKNGQTRRFEAVLKGNKKNSAGKIVRKNVVIARAVIAVNVPAFNMDLVPVNPRMGRKLYFDYTQGELYKEYIHTHGELFTTLEGRVYGNGDLKQLVSFFSIYDKENRFSVKEGLSFLLSPLGMDSVLQTAVLYGVAHPAEDVPVYYSKLPVGFKNCRVLRPFEQDTRYKCRGNLFLNSEKDMELGISVEDMEGQTFLEASKVLLKEAPFVEIGMAVTKLRREEHYNRVEEVIL